MSYPNKFFNVSLDESVFRQVFESMMSGVNDRLHRHDEEIEELRKLLAQKELELDARHKEMEAKIDLTDLEKFRNEIRAEFLVQIKEANEKISGLESRISKLEAKCNVMDSTCHEMSEKVSFCDKISEEFAQMQSSHITKNDLERLTERIKTVENVAERATSRIQQTRDCLLTVSSAFASVARKRVSLEAGLNRTMQSTAEEIINNFRILFEAVKYVGPMSESGGQEMKVSTASNSFAVTAPPTTISYDQKKDADLSDIELKDYEPFDFRKNPTLPRLTKFKDLRDCVKYIYKLIPRLQAILDALYEKLYFGPQADEKFVRKSDLESRLENITGALNTQKRQLDECRLFMKRAPSQRELVNALKIARSDVDQDGVSSAIGCMKCIACGRDISQVAGAMSEIEANDIFGSPVNIVMRPSPFGTPIQPIYGGSLDSPEITGLIETPRAVRPFRATSIGRNVKLQIPGSPK
jgi:uncharacterized coiled-coil protein SlyX